jgi:hypothetical protein
MELYSKRLVQADPKASGAMELLKKGHGGFLLDQKPLKDGGIPLPQDPTFPTTQPAEAKATAPPRPPATIFQWVDNNGRVQISDQPPPRGAKRIRVFDGSSD